MVIHELPQCAICYSTSFWQTIYLPFLTSVRAVVTEFAVTLHDLHRHNYVDTSDLNLNITKAIKPYLEVNLMNFYYRSFVFGWWPEY